MRYYNEIKSRDREMAYVAVAIYFIVLCAVLFFVKFTFDSESLTKVSQESIQITFGEMGDTDKDGGKSSSRIVKTDKGKTASTPVPNIEEALDNDYADDAIIFNPEKKKSSGVNARALYKANSGSHAPSSDSEKVTGSSSSSADSYERYNDTVSLDGRYIVGNLPYPDYVSNSQGSVVIEIHVNQLGEVTHAAFITKGSTTNDGRLIREALKAAKKATFNVDRQSSVIQSGVITYVFNLR